MIGNAFSILADFLKGIAAKVAAFLAGYFTGRLAQDKRAAEEEAGQKGREADAWRNRPRNGTDLADRLFKLAKRKSGDR